MKPAGTQTDKNLEFDGVGAGPKKGPNRFAGNHWSGHSNDGREVNKGRGPTRGNQDYRGIGGKSVTKDAFRAAPTDGLPSVNKASRDNINAGGQVRTPGGTRTWEPSKTQNYKGNPDKIRIDQSGGGSFNREQRGSRPTTAAGQSDFNYGPKSQY